MHDIYLPLEDNRGNYQNCHYHYICTIIIGSSYSFRFRSFFCVLCFIKVKLSVKVKLFVLLLFVCAILPGKAVPEMTYTVSSRMLNPTHSLTHYLPSYLLFILLVCAGVCSRFGNEW